SAVVNEYDVEIKLFGLFPVKEAKVKIVEKTSVIVGGEPFGMKLFSDGVMVTGFSSINTENGSFSPGKDANLQKGDIIISLNNKTVSNNTDVIKIIENSQDGNVTFQIKRNGTAMNLQGKAVKSKEDNKYKMGVWVRDSSAGIGTVTFYNTANSSFAGLGHPICDVDTGNIVPLKEGEIVKVSIDSVTKGNLGKAGELNGHFSGLTSIGVLKNNNVSGVYGNYNSNIGLDSSNKELLEIAMKQDIKTGSAYIYTTINGTTPQKFDIEIEKIASSDNSNDTKNMIIHIVDENLINKTGGIVQGMSGSPIIQNGKLIGAVTHVFVNDPTRGYAIFAETMNKTAKSMYN
ncbi:MAG: SpoIVB peptidase, partial [Clostridia bacterium]